LRPINILFLCTHNSARSILGEVITNILGQNKFIGYSAGSSPGTKIHPLAKEIATEMGYDPNKLYSKSWDEFIKPDAVKMDIIITVCDNAANETCPIFPGHPMKVHWGLKDPSNFKKESMKEEFKKTAFNLKKKINLLINLSVESFLNTDTLRTKLLEIHKITASS